MKTSDYATFILSFLVTAELIYVLSTTMERWSDVWQNTILLCFFCLFFAAALAIMVSIKWSISKAFAKK